MEQSVQALLRGQTYDVLMPASLHKTVVSQLCCDSRKAVPGSFFFCLTGANVDGHAYAKAAYDKGARVFAVERSVELPADATVIRFANTREALAHTSAAFYGYPHRRLKIIGITGTKGKTTTALLIHSILTAAGISAGYIGTNGIMYADKQLPSVNTTPESLELQKHLYDMAESGVTAVALEVSSQALWMHRVDGVEFDACLFTNLSRDHVGGCEHPTFEHYKNSKRALFAAYKAGAVFCNADDPSAGDMVVATDKEDRVVRVSLQDPTCQWYAADVTPRREGARLGVSFECHHKNRVGHGYLNVPGTFNVSNAMLALAVCHDRFGVPLDGALSHLGQVSVAGRFEPVYVPSMPDVTFLLDYAHNRASLQASLETLQDYRPNRLICLVGSVGDRSFERRADLADVAGRMADFCIVTSDNPGKEPPRQIIDEMLEAFPEDGCPRIGIEDRAEAIAYAVGMAQSGDIVLLAGKGHEAYQLIGTERVPFSEREILLKAAEDAEILV
jgi:UDP-N-acetylmuramoyl-L-alanyl-D-glutamate--2,6-diaminopimelate ligase